MPPQHRSKLPLQVALAQLAEGVAHLGIDDGTHLILATLKRQLTVSVPLRRDDGTVAVYTGHRVQHSLTRGPAKGGRRHARGHSAATRATARPAGGW